MESKRKRKGEKRKRKTESDIRQLGSVCWVWTGGRRETFTDDPKMNKV